MSKVNILWMYDDLLDLYGDWGNLLAVTKGLDAMGIPWEIDHKAWGISRTFPRYQMIYIGPKARNLAESTKIWPVKNRLCWMRWSAALCSWQLGTAAFCSAKSFTGADGQQIPGIGLLFGLYGRRKPATSLFPTYWLTRYSRRPHLMVFFLSTEPPIFMVMTGIRSLL